MKGFASVGGKIILARILPIARQNGNCQCGKIWQNVPTLFYAFSESPGAQAKLLGKKLQYQKI
jgi:hypothetical protein